ncbi:hypothetical protein FQN50_003929 [Emmonsiellopsis sp. PD_5]|nr:hypothetical protein FQN50_003929 [Emmonsiellopsis sp. PD_5]
MSSVAVIIKPDSNGPRINDVLRLDEHMRYHELFACAWDLLSPEIPQIYMDEGVNSFVGATVIWATDSHGVYPPVTTITENNFKAVVQLLTQRRGADVVQLSFNSTD